MRKKIIIASLASIFLAWLFIGDIGRDNSNKPIKKIITTKALQIFGKRNLWVFSRSEELYNYRGKLTSRSYYHDNKCDSKYTYIYTKFDSIQKIIWLAGENLTPQRIELWKYNSLNKPYQNLVYEVNKLKHDTLLQEKTTYLYDKSNRPFKTIIQHFSKEYPSTATLTTFTNSFNEKGLNLFTRSTFYAPGTIDTSTYITRYTYDKNGRVATEVGGLTADSIHYKRNSKGQIVEKRNASKLFNTIDKTWYDNNGNKIKSYLDNEGGHTYEYEYNDYSRLLKVYHPGSFLFILKPCTTYEYEYY